ncbi:MAG TPA: tetratricopeptide repeat protein [Planctomycetota bacterium]|nr:tetratricopeptide repeat protein [Planctomycetota bacterium]
MSLRKEPVVLVATVIVVGLLVWSSLEDKPRTTRAKGAANPDLVVQRVPDVALVTPVQRDLGRLTRDLFSPPSDTHPLPPLDIDPPPLAPLSAVFPPPMPGPAPAQYGILLRADATPTAVAGLFATDLASAAELAGGEELSGASPGSSASALAALGYVNGGKPAAQAPEDALNAEQRAAQVAGYKRLYDWLRLDNGPIRYTQIRNKDKFALKARKDDPLVFVEIDPVTGLLMNSGMVVTAERPRVNEFHFADTVANRISERQREFGETVTPGQYGSVMAFADECVASRNESSEALDIAIAMYKLADSVSPKDPAPKLGLARCYELKFDFEAAYAQLEALLKEYEHSPEVKVRMGQLEARLRLFDSAEQRFVEALRGVRQSFEGQWAYGRYLLDRNRAGEALEHLELAHKFEPPAERQTQRLDSRLDLAAARLANGKLDGGEGASGMYDSALSIEARDSRALGGKLAVLVVKRAPTETALVLGRDQAGFEMLLAEGLAKIQAKKWTEARDTLLAAADADPLRAYAAWRALSWLAEVTGYPAEAMRYVDLALEAAPDDAWSLYQRGRLLFQRDDPEGAQRDFKAALDRELAFTDAIASLAEIAALAGRETDAEMYFGRALELDHSRAELLARRGYNLLGLNDSGRAETCFKAAKALDDNEPAAQAGLAWCAYRRNDSDSAKVEFRKLDDARRSKPETDAWRVFAQQQIKRIADHIAKEAWEENFDRGTRQLNGWDYDEAAGPIFTLVDNTMVLKGVVNQSQGRSRMKRSYPANDFISIEMDVTVKAITKARVGVFVSKERKRGDQFEATNQITVERHPEGGLQVLLEDRATSEQERTDIAPVGGVPWWPEDKPVRLRIERLGEGSDSTGRISVDGIPVESGFPMRAIVSSGEVNVGIFAIGDTGTQVDLVIDNVQVVRRHATR